MSNDLREDEMTEQDAGPFQVQRQSFIRLVYAFELDKHGTSRATPFRSTPLRDIVGEVEDDSTINKWTDLVGLSSHVLTHLSDHLNVSTAGADQAEVAHWWTLSRDSLTEAPHGSVPVSWKLDLESHSVEFNLSGVELAVFNTMIGMLILELSPAGESADDFLDLLHHSRFYALDLGRPQDRLANASHSSRARRISPLRPKSEGPSVSSRGEHGFGPLIRMLLDDAFGYQRGDQRRSWTPAHIVGRMSSYSALIVRSGDDSSDRDDFELEYRWRRLLHSRSAVAANHHDDLQDDLVPYGTGMLFSYSLDGGGFLGVDLPSDQFFHSGMSEHLRGPYFLGFALATHQRLALVAFSTRAADAWRYGSVDVREVRALQDSFLQYVVSCSFIQVMQTANHHASHKKWLATLEIGPFQREVEGELQRLYERVVLDEQIQRQCERDDERIRAGRSGQIVATAGLAFALPSLGIGALQVASPNGASGLVAVVTIVCLAVLGAAIGIAASWMPRFRSTDAVAQPDVMPDRQRGTGVVD